MSDPIAGGGSRRLLRSSLRNPFAFSFSLSVFSLSPYLRHRLLERVRLGAALLGDLLARGEGHFEGKLFGVFERKRGSEWR